MGVFDNLFRRDKKEKKNGGAKANFIDDEWVEVSASSRDEAIDRAATALNANPDHLEIKWLSKDGKKLRARKVEEGAAKPRRSQKSSRGGRGRQEQDRDFNRRDGRNKRDDRDFNRRDSRDNRDDDRNFNHRDDRDDDHRDDDRDFNRRDSRDNRDDARDFNHRDGRNNDRSYQARDEKRYDRHDNDDVEDYEEEVEESTPHGAKAKDYLIEIIKYIDEPATVEVYETNKTIRLEIESAESGLFIGKHGQTLEAIQHLMMKIMMKEEHHKFLVIDAEDYRLRREEALESKARKLAKKAKKEKRPVGVEPMNAIDRRIVHMALKGEPGVETKSIGEGSSRRVLIVPKGFQRRQNNNHRHSNNNRNRNHNNYRGDKEYEGPSRGESSYDDYS